MTVYKNNTEWFESTDTGIFGSGDTPMEKVIKVNTKLAKLISVVAASVKDYADLRMPDYDAPWEDGHPTKYKQMGFDDFKNAGENIGRVVTAAALGLMGYDPEGKPTSYQTIIKKYMMTDDDDVQEERTAETRSADLDTDPGARYVFLGNADSGSARYAVRIPLPFRRR